MNRLQSINTRKWLLVPVFSAFAAYAQASGTADSSGDTQNRVRAVLEGELSHLESGRPASVSASVRVADIQESTRRTLMGTSSSNAGMPVTISGSTATARPRQDGDMQSQIPRSVLGRAAS